MPKALEDKLRKQAAKEGITGDRRNAYVYGTMREMGWKPAREKRKSLRNKRAESME